MISLSNIREEKYWLTYDNSPVTRRAWNRGAFSRHIIRERNLDSTGSQELVGRQVASTFYAEKVTGREDQLPPEQQNLE